MIKPIDDGKVDSELLDKLELVFEHDFNNNVIKWKPILEQTKEQIIAGSESVTIPIKAFDIIYRKYKDLEAKANRLEKLDKHLSESVVLSKQNYGTLIQDAINLNERVDHLQKLVDPMLDERIEKINNS